jgi:hypothetical protein
VSLACCWRPLGCDPPRRLKQDALRSARLAARHRRRLTRRQVGSRPPAPRAVGEVLSPAFVQNLRSGPAGAGNAQQAALLRRRDRKLVQCKAARLAAENRPLEVRREERQLRQFPFARRGGRPGVPRRRNGRWVDPATAQDSVTRAQAAHQPRVRLGRNGRRPTVRRCQPFAPAPNHEPYRQQDPDQSGMCRFYERLFSRPQAGADLLHHGSQAGLARQGACRAADAVRGGSTCAATDRESRRPVRRAAPTAAARRSCGATRLQSEASVRSPSGRTRRLANQMDASPQEQ